MGDLTKRLRLVLEWGAEGGFARTARLDREAIEAGVTMHTVAGAVRRGWLKPVNGVYRTTDKGRAALAQEQSHER